MQKINIAVVGLGFGAAFAPFYKLHPHVGRVVLCDAQPERLQAVSEKCGIAETRETLDEVLADASIDAVHLLTGVDQHAAQTIQVLQTGKHCACAVPMATSIEELQAIIAAVRASGLHYMMMETQNYSDTCLHLENLLRDGVFGTLQFLRGVHYQDMENWPPYWAGLPPMWYATHPIGPLLKLAKTRARSVMCLGSGLMREELHRPYGNPFPLQSALFELERETPLAMEITRSLFHTARGYLEGFSVYGEDATLEMPRVLGETPLLFQQSKLGEFPGSRRATHESVEVPHFADLLPAEYLEVAPRGSAIAHLVHEFISSIVEGRRAAIDEIEGANCTVAGICAHESALRGGEKVLVPDFSG